MLTDFKNFSGRWAEIFCRKTLTLLIISIPKKLCIDLQLLERTHNKSKVCLHTATWHVYLDAKLCCHYKLTDWLFPHLPSASLVPSCRLHASFLLAVTEVLSCVPRAYSPQWRTMFEPHNAWEQMSFRGQEHHCYILCEIPFSPAVLHYGSVALTLPIYRVSLSLIIVCLLEWVSHKWISEGRFKPLKLLTAQV